MRVKKVSYINDYKIQVLFSNGKTKIVDLKNEIKNFKGLLLALKNINYFKKVSLDDCQFTICWPNGADICPDVLYAIGVDVIKKKKASISKKKIIN